MITLGVLKAGPNSIPLTGLSNDRPLELEPLRRVYAETAVAAVIDVKRAQRRLHISLHGLYNLYIPIYMCRYGSEGDFPIKTLASG